jgi:ribosome maturation factor RimP
MEVIDRVKELTANYLEQNGMELVDIMYRREQGGMTLRLLVDTPEGVTIDECEALNNYLSELLDKENIIEEHYLIEVASPGLDRPIKTDPDFRRSMGKVIDITTYIMIDGRKTHEGKLVGMDKESIVVESEGITTVIPKDKIAMARLKIEI